MRSIHVLSSIRHLKVVVYFQENRVVSASICSKDSNYKYLVCYLVANSLIKTMCYNAILLLWEISGLSCWIAKHPVG